MSGTRPPGAPAGHPARREYGFALLSGAVGAGLILLAVRQQWARAVFTPPKPLTPQVVNVSGADLVPLAGALALRRAGRASPRSSPPGERCAGRPGCCSRCSARARARR